MASATQVTVNITDPDTVSVDQIVWSTNHVTYVDLVDRSGLTVTVCLAETSLLSFITSILDSAGVRAFNYSSGPAGTMQYHGDATVHSNDADASSDDEADYLADRYSYLAEGYFEDPEDEHHDNVDEYGYEKYSWDHESYAF